ncbi:rhomboid family intramembrane serine protease [Candidatus Pacearchaeota archaeon]|nr:rhomboid family intramembrane serine protease [Candidatus Pacearchaeota archaeon]
MKNYTIQKRSNVLQSFSATTTIIGINIIAFIVFFAAIAISKDSSKMINYGAIMPANIIAGKYLWTFVTSMFLHGGFFHLFANMFSLFFIGSLTERILGKKRFFWFYMISGIVAGLLFVALGFFFQMDLNTYAVGASGALFALIGFLMLITPNLSVYLMFIPIPIKMKYAAPGILIVLWLISVAGNIPIGNSAHLGGLLAGLAYGMYIKKKYKNKTRMIKNHFR